MGVFKNIRHGTAVAVCIAAMSIGLAAAGQASTAHAATAAYPQIQYGTVYSCATHQNGSVKTSDGGYVWDYDGPGGAGTPLVQVGAVYSSTTGRYANVRTRDGGLHWAYAPNALCSAP
jgi:hypothetical protein